jgi:hypothetical protein
VERMDESLNRSLPRRRMFWRPSPRSRGIQAEPSRTSCILIQRKNTIRGKG